MAPKLIVNEPARPVPRPTASPGDFGAAEAQATTQVGRSMSATASVMGAAMDQRARYKATQYRSALNDAAQEILDDPNLEGREERLEQARRSLSREYRAGNTSTFDREASLFESQIGARFRHQTRLHAIELGQSDLSDHLQSLSDEWARADGDEDAQADALSRAQGAVDGALESGLIDANLADESLRRFQRNGARGRFAKLLREDPEAAVMLVSEPREGVDEVERQGLLTQALNAHAGVLRAERLADEARAKAEEDAEAQRIEDIERDFVEMDGRGELSVGDVLASMAFLDADTGRLWLDRARSGGGSGRGGSIDRVAHLRLQDVVASGDPMAEKNIRDAYRDGAITKGIYDELLDEDLRHRFGAANKYLIDSLDTGEIILDGPAAMPLMARRADALREFDDWKRDNKESTRSEAMRVADHIARSAQMVDTSGIAAFQLQPTYLVGKPMEPDFEATEAAIDDALEAGDLDVRGAAYELRLLENLRRISDRSAQVQGQ